MSILLMCVIQHTVIPCLGVNILDGVVEEKEDMYGCTITILTNGGLGKSLVLPYTRGTCLTCMIPHAVLMCRGLHQGLSGRQN
jgi:hypothetical protein